MIKRDKLGRFVKGHKPFLGTEKTRFKKGEKAKNWNGFKKGHTIRKGVKLTEEGIIKRTETRRKNGWFKNPKEHKIRISKANKGKKKPPRSEEHNKNQREAQKKYLKEHPEEIERLKKQRAKIVLPLKDSSIEVKIQNFLKKLGIEFFTHQYINIKHAYQCDILIPSMNLIIECDGEFIHCNPLKYSPDFVRFPRYETKTAKDIWKLDNARTKELIEKGFKVLRLWEFEIKEMDINDFQNKIETIK